ncbi:MAG: hypothetical protein AB7F64_09105 [Gammaproteobacteria bacterium]
MYIKVTKFFDISRLALMMLLSIFLTTSTSSAAPEDSYLVNINMNVQLLPAGSKTPRVLSNQKVFVNTIKSAPSGKAFNQYLTTDENGQVDFTVGADLVGAIFTVYLVDSKSDSIRLNCKLGRVDDIYMNYITVPALEDLSEVYNLVLTGSQCQ